MKITRGRLKELVREVMTEESEYNTFVKTALEKTGKSLGDMSDEETKDFFNKIDSKWKAKDESVNETELDERQSAEQHANKVLGNKRAKAADINKVRTIVRNRIKAIDKQEGSRERADEKYKLQGILKKLEKQYVSPAFKNESDLEEKNVSPKQMYQRQQLATLKKSKADHKKIQSLKKKQQDRYNKKNESVNENFDKIYKAFDKKDYFHTKDRIKTMLGNWERAKAKGDKGAEKYTEKDIVNHVVKQAKDDALNSYKVIETFIKKKDVDSLKRHIRYDQPFSQAVFTYITGEKLPKTTRDIHAAIDSYFSKNESINEASKFKPKFKKGDSVYYLPKLSGFNPKTKLIITHATWQEEDSLAKSMGVTSTPTWVYHFKNSNLGAVEKDLKSVNESINEGKKIFSINPSSIGKAKYSIDFHDGKSKNKDGSPFIGISTAKSKAELKSKIEKFKSDGYNMVSKVFNDLHEDGKLQGGADDPCWKGYEMVGMKKGKGGKDVPNCVPKNESVNESINEGTNWTEDEKAAWENVLSQGRKVASKSKSKAQQQYKNLFKQNLVTWDGFNDSVMLNNKGEDFLKKHGDTLGENINESSSESAIEYRTGISSQKIKDFLKRNNVTADSVIKYMNKEDDMHDIIMAMKNKSGNKYEKLVVKSLGENINEEIIFASSNNSKELSKFYDELKNFMPDNHIEKMGKTTIQIDVSKNSIPLVKKMAKSYKGIDVGVGESINEESEYKTFFKKALEKAGKDSITSMSDEEKKAFFNKIDAKWKAKGEKKESVEEGYHTAVDAKPIADKMRKNKIMKAFADKVEKLGKVSTNDLMHMLPDYVAGGDIIQLFKK